MRVDWIFFSVIGLLLIIERGRTQSDWTYMDEASQVHNTIMHKYDSRVRPSPHPNTNPAPPVQVDLGIKLIYLRNFDVANQEIQTVLDFHMSWKDGRLLWNPNQVQKIITNTSIIWKPDIAFINAIDNPKLIGKSLGTVFSDGKITTIERYVVTTVCDTYPDEERQVCTITLGSLVLSDHDQKFRNPTVGLDEGFTNHKWDIDSVFLMEQAINLTDSRNELFTRIHMNLGLQKVSPPTTNSTYTPEYIRLNNGNRQEGAFLTLIGLASMLLFVLVL